MGMARFLRFNQSAFVDCNAEDVRELSEVGPVSASAPRAGRGSMPEGARSPVWRMFKAAATALLVLILAGTITTGILMRRSSDGVATLLGHPVLVVLSGSMVPTFRTGDLVIDDPITRKAATELRVGQIITFRVSDFPSGTILVTHRIFRVLKAAPSSKAASSRVTYMTKGDANNAPDSWTVAPSQILGMYQARIPDGGYVLRFLESGLGFASALVLAVAWIASGEFRRRWRGAASPRQPRRHKRGAGSASSTSGADPERSAQGGGMPVP